MLGLVLMALAAGGGVPASGGPDTHAKFRIVAESTAATPGSTTWLGLAFTIEPRWHMYWDGQNDSGIAPHVDDPGLPAGYKLGPWLWPVPKRQVLPGEILDHVYESAVTILVPLEVPKAAKPGERAKVSLKAEWLECANICMFGEGEGSIEIPIVADAKDIKPAPDAKLFESARKSLPKPLPKAGDISATLKDGRLVLQAKGAQGLAYMPRKGSTPVPDLARAGEAKGAELALDLAPEAGKKPTAWGVLEVRREAGKLEHYEVDLGRSAPAGKVDPDPTKAPK